MVGTNSHRMTNCMNPVSDAFMVNLVQYQAVAEYLPSGEACPSIWWNHAIIAFCDVPFQIALSLACLDARRAFYGRAAALVGAFCQGRRQNVPLRYHNPNLMTGTPCELDEHRNKLD